MSHPPASLSRRTLRLDLGRRGGLRRRIYLAFLAAAVVPTAIAGLIGITVSLDTLRAQTVAHLQQEVHARVSGVQLFFDQVAAELRFIAEMSSVDALFDAVEAGVEGRVRERAHALERDFLRLSELHPHVYQMRLLDAKGMERVRVEKHGDKLVPVSAERLQDKSDRYYFREALSRPHGDLYVSPLDLNQEFGRVEQPERPVIRVAKVVVDVRDQVRGVVVVNLHAQVLLDPLQEMVNEREGVAYLFDRAGHYLSRSSGQRAVAQMSPIDSLPASLGANTVSTLLAGSRGPTVTGGQIIAHEPVEFGAAYSGVDRSRWVMALTFPERELWRSVLNLYLLYAVLLAALLVTAYGGYTLSRRLLGPLEGLKREAELISEGDFTRRVQVTGHDEVAELGARFNLMADRLASLVNNLQAHRERLAADVASRTRELASERARLASVFRQAGEAIVAVDAEGRITLANAAACQLFGQAAARSGQRLADCWPEWPALRQAAAPHETLRRDVILGEHVLAVSVGTSLEEGDSHSHVIVARDVSEERRIQDERRRLDRQMFQIEKLATMGELAMGVAHEIGNPLAGMKAVVQSLQYERDLPGVMREPLRRLESEVDRLSGFLRGFHGFAAPLALDLRPVELRELVDDVLFWVGKEARQQGVKIDVDLAEGLPPILADLPQIKQVLLNLAVNALHAMPEGGRLGIRAVRQDGGVRIEVSDSGHGIAPDVLPHIFDPFYTTRTAGSGLGLAITAKIVREHGARVEVESAPGKGARFVLVWPSA